MVKCICEHCGKEFERNMGELKKAKKHYCSRECKFLASRHGNDFIEHPDYIEVISLYQGKNYSILLDLEDWLKFKETGYKITVSKKDNDTTYYAKIHNKSIHRLIMNCPKDKLIDHINHNGLDNRKINLRVCSALENNRNRKTKSGHTGVYWSKKRNKWKAELEINNKSKFGGYFDNLKNAIQARKKLELKHWGVSN